MTSARTVTVIKAYQCAYQDPLIVRHGETVSTEQKDCEWPGWTWCRTADGNEGWLPETYLTRRADVGQATLNRDVDATELTVAVGDVLTIVEEVAGWVQCQTEDSTVGWIPAENVEEHGI